MSDTLTCQLALSPSLGSISRIEPSHGCRSPVQHFLPSSPSNLTSDTSYARSELSFSPSSIGSTQQNISSDIEEIFNLRAKNPNNPLIGFLNINSLRNKITDPRMVVERCLPDILVIEETKLNSDFKSEAFSNKKLPKTDSSR